MDDAHTVLTDADVLVVDDRIAAVGPDLTVPDGHRRDRRDRRHRHARDDRHPPAHVADRHARLRRRLDADPVLRLVLPGARQALPPGGRARRQPAGRDRGASTRASPPPSTGRTACRPSTTPTPPSTRCSRCPAGSCSPTATSSSRPAEWTGAPGVPRLRRAAGSPATTCSASRSRSTSPATRPSPSRPPSRWPASSASPVTTHAGVWGATNDDGIRLMHDHGFMTPETIYVHAATLSAGLLPPHRRHRRLRLGLHRERAERRPGLPAHLGDPRRTASRSRCRWTPASGGAATCSPPCAPRSAPTAPASTWRRTPRATPSRTRSLRAEQVVDWATRGGARALGRDDALGSIEAGKKADVVLIKNDALAGLVPAAQPLRPRRVPGPARRRAHRARRRPRREARAPPGRRRPRRGPPPRSSRPSITCGRRWARRRGRRA